MWDSFINNYVSECLGGGMQDNDINTSVHIEM